MGSAAGALLVEHTGSGYECVFVSVELLVDKTAPGSKLNEVW